MIALRSFFAPFVVASLGCLAGGLVSCGSDGVVDGGCAAGFTACGLRCVDLENDRKNCGACGTVCSAGYDCGAGVCYVSGSEGAGGQGGDAEAGPGNAESGADTGDGNAESATTPDADAANDVNTVDGDQDVQVGGDAGDSASACVPPFDNPSHCGDCATSCSGATPVCAASAGGGFGCEPLCTMPLEACNGACVDKTSDENNCGSCGNVCMTGICQNSQCVGAGFGHVVVIGMDYTVAITGQPPAMILGNAAFLAAHNPVRILAYGEYANPTAVSGVGNVLTWASTVKGRNTTLTNAGSAGNVASSLASGNYDTLLVYDQPSAPPGTLAADGTAWNAALDAFTNTGGVVIVLDGGTGKLADGGANAGAGTMKDLLTTSGLLPVSGETAVSGTALNVTAPADAIGLNVATPFLARTNSVAFTTSLAEDGTHVFVAKNQANTLPVVVHTVKVPTP